MNGKPQLIFGQSQLMGPNELQRRAKYTTPTLSPVGNGNSFASLLSSAVGQSGQMAQGTEKITGSSAPAKSPAVAASVRHASSPASLTDSRLSARKPVPAEPSVAGSVSGGRAVLASPLPAGTGGDMPASMPKRVVSMPKNYNFGMEDTRPRHLTRPASAGKQAMQAGTVSSARSINTMAMQSRYADSSGQGVVEKFISGNGSLGDTPYRGLSLSRENSDINAMNSLKKMSKGKKGFLSPLLSGGSTQLLIQLVKEAGHVVGTVNGILNVKEAPVLAQKRRSAPVQITGNPGSSSAPLSSSNSATVSSGTASMAVSAAGGPAGGMEMGSLSAKFESGENGIGAIGYDRHGGTSYGKYQISSRAGTFTGFMEYLDINAPDMAARLREGGAANTGSRYGKMPTIWRAMAEAEPERFEQLQTDFIMSSHYQPAVSAIAEATGVAIGSMPEALREVVFSTAVQHGVAGAAKIISRAVASVGAEKLTADQETFLDLTGQDLIRQIYAIRARQFSSSTSMVRHAVQNRLQEEMNDALTLLRTASEGQKNPIAYNFKA